MLQMKHIVRIPLTIYHVSQKKNEKIKPRERGDDKNQQYGDTIDPSSNINFKPTFLLHIWP